MRRANGEISSDEDLNEDLSKYPVVEACAICEGELKTPIVTKCNHFFCEKCAVDQYKKSPLCYICSKSTNGTFSDGRGILKKNRDR